MFEIISSSIRSFGQINSCKIVSLIKFLKCNTFLTAIVVVRTTVHMSSRMSAATHWVSLVPPCRQDVMSNVTLRNVTLFCSQRFINSIDVIMSK
jgi:hypothetical protein